MSDSATKTAMDFVSPLTGLKVSHVWRSLGTAIFVELGDLLEEAKHLNPQGQCTIAIEWSWRLENESKIVLGSFSDDAYIDSISKQLSGASVETVSFFSHLLEIDVLFSNGLRLSSFSTVEGDPEWSIRVGNCYVYAKSGKFVYETAA